MRSAPYCRWYSTGKADVTIVCTATTGHLIRRLLTRATTRLLFVHVTFNLRHGSGPLRKTAPAQAKPESEAKRTQ